MVTPDDIEFAGGPRNTFDPENGYHDAYQAVWGMQTGNAFPLQQDKGRDVLTGATFLV